ncbi:60S ribosome subunit biogenesis protein NIP7 homolog [Penaeus monodon]|uniref:60S ribosome subunit biogenesis protein NIP7 homolog n=1 Tax=Penaeus monodon TaxID=6687 RepID=UPI0018A7A75D|nr:60S ribosome subunit biogenesis protein NIP7 homolog [Penaeus monodon]XP_047492344.1 60S ribosome subunit biogenesis protein NIP7 homolog [Penaeus chinensis]
MRTLSDDETALVFTKLSKYIGSNIKSLLDRSDGLYCFRLHKGRVYYVKEDIMKVAALLPRENLVSMGVCFGKITKGKKFLLNITALEFLSPYCQHKVWVKEASEQNFMYGNHIYKSGLFRISDNTPKYAGVVVYTHNDIPMGFGVAAKSTSECRHANPMDIICFHQADIGEYIRNEDTLV